jgi:hypothetical protein
MLDWHFLRGDIKTNDLLLLLPPQYLAQESLVETLRAEFTDLSLSFQILWDDMLKHLSPDEECQLREQRICLPCVKNIITEMFPGWIRRYLARGH